jgi:hypothetical protein
VTGERSHAPDPDVAPQPNDGSSAPGPSPAGFTPDASRMGALSPQAVLSLQRAAGNRAAGRAIARSRASLPLAAKLVQRDPQPFTPAPAPGVFPPSPPVPGSAGAVRAEALEIGRRSGSVLADIDSALGVLMRDRAGVRVWDRMSAEDKATFAKESAARFDQLPQLRRVDAPELAAAQEDGFNAGVAQGYEAGKLETFLVNLGTEVALILITAIAAGSLLPRLLMRVLGRGATVIFGGAGDTMTLYRYAKVAGDVQPSGWWTTRQAASRAEAARLTGVPESECLFEQRVTVNAAPSKYEPFFASKPARAVGESLVEEFKNKVLIPRTAMEVRPMP